METVFWLGSQKSYAEVEAIRSGADFKGFSAEDIDTDPRYRSMLVNVHDDVAIISVRGSLVAGSTGYGVRYGVVGYDDIKGAALWAAKQPSVRALVYDIDSGGGEVAGMFGAAGFISRLASAKPSVTFSDGHMCSAAAGLGTAAGYVMAGETAMIGSVGVLMQHVDRSQKLERDGVKVTLIRAGSEKALANPYEPLSDKAKESLQKQADVLYDSFLGQMAKQRNVSKAAAETLFGQGREFIGKQAVAAGLVDKLGSLDDAVRKARSLAANFQKVKATGARASLVVPDNRATMEKPMSLTLTDEQLAELSASVQVEAAATVPEVLAEVTPTASAPAPTPTEAPLLDRLFSVMEQNATLSVTNTKLREDLSSRDEQVASLLTLGRQQVKTLGLHFGVQSAAVDSMDATTVLSEYTRLSKLFVDKFPAGRVAAPISKIDTPKVTVDPLYVATLKAAIPR